MRLVICMRSSITSKIKTAKISVLLEMSSVKCKYGEPMIR